MPTQRPRGGDAAAITPIERFLAAVATLLVGLALVGFALTLVQLAMQERWTWLQEGWWPYAFLAPALLLPVGFLCIVALLIIAAVRKARGRG